jgi:hypothetical protein
MKDSKRLLSPEAQREIEYHLNGLIEAAALVRRQARILTSHLENDVQKVAAALSQLEVEIFFHLDFHMKHLRRPLARLTNRAYVRLEKEEKALLTKASRQQRRARKRVGDSTSTRKRS